VKTEVQRMGVNLVKAQQLLQELETLLRQVGSDHERLVAMSQ